MNPGVFIRGGKGRKNEIESRFPGDFLLPCTCALGIACCVAPLYRRSPVSIKTKTPAESGRLLSIDNQFF
jgi:hypothetical protein